MGTEILGIENGNVSIRTLHSSDREPGRKETETTPPRKHTAVANICYACKLHSNYITNHSHFITSEKYLQGLSAQTLLEKLHPVIKRQRLGAQQPHQLCDLEQVTQFSHL